MKLESNLEFEVLGFSDSRYEKLTVEVKYKGESIAQINQDKGMELLEIEVFADLNSAILKVPFSGFLGAMNLARGFIVESG
ncbi:hypothetical protein [Pseudomonas maumuensis]|uniref:Uncharacterized protein n=1 Tax=Pseudomonas maumuensis TaxID=2842354 RepID=A0ABX8NST7_9PSED|nr:hypothetical protein [Pseudomonas maumuensis]QXH58832.1 hypothetical protein KSS90_11675 [Pseudomonas maumuensis]